MNIFQRKIGIWYQTKEWAEYIFNTICEESADDIDFNRGATLRSRNELRIVFKNGDTINFVPISENSRGRRFTESYVQSDLSLTDSAMIVVRSCTTYGEIYLVNEYEDLAYYRRKNLRSVF